MGREIKRVPLNFDWPLGKTWKGFIRPDKFDEDQCPDCIDPSDPSYSDGYTREARAIARTFYPHMIMDDFSYPRKQAEALAWCDKIGQAEVDNLVAEGRLTTWSKEEGHQSLPRTAEEINRINREGGMSGHDAINRWIMVKFRCKQLGIEVSCKTCEGHCSLERYPGQREEAEAWEWTQPPEGDGWQMWETISEGSPVTPVFATAEGLATYMSTVGVWDQVHNYDDALCFILGPGWAPSFVTTTTEDGITTITDGVEATL